MLVSPNRRHARKYFYKYMTAPTAKVSLINQSLRLSSPLLFNDPFDVSRVLRLSFTTEEMSKRLTKELAELIRNKASADMTHNETMKALLEYSLNMNEEQREYLAITLEQQVFGTNYDKLPSFIDMQAAWDTMIPQTRILSLTEENDNPVMWSSYGVGYTGVVLELECIDVYDSVLLVAEPVAYSDDPPTLGPLEYWVKMTTGQAPFDYQKIFKRLELTKATKWSYEKEWRVVSLDRKSSDLYTDYGMRPRTFSKIYFGKEMSIEDKSDLLRLIAHDLAHMEAYEMHVDQASQKLVYDRIKPT